MVRRRGRRGLDREHGTGSIYRDGDGYRAEIRVYPPGGETADPKAETKAGKGKGKPGKLLRKRSKDVDFLHDWLDEQVRVFIRGGKPLPVTKGEPMTLVRYGHAWIDRRKEALSPKTVLVYRNTLDLYVAPSIGSKPLTAITRQEMRAFTQYLASRTPPLSYETQHQHWRNLRAILNAARRDELIERVPVDPEDGPVRPRSVVPVKPLDRALSDEHIGEVVAVLREGSWACTPANHSEGRCGLEWLLAITYGIRQGERLAIRRGDVDLHFTGDVDPEAARGVLTLQRHAERHRWEHGCEGGDATPSCGRRFGSNCPQRTGGGMFSAPGLKWKTGEHGTHALYLDTTMVEAFEEHLAALTKAGVTGDEALVFGHEGSGEVIRQPEQDTRIWRAIQDEARIRREDGTYYAVHDLRHTAATVLANSVNLASAKAILGHSDLRTTMRYVHSTPERTAPAIHAVTKRLGILGQVAATERTRRATYKAEYEELMARSGGDPARLVELLDREFALSDSDDDDDDE